MNTKLTPKVSVIIPSYNHGRFIENAINSVLNQTFKDFELIIADDASPDDSVEKIRRFKDSRIKFYSFEQNKGAVDTTNFCITKCVGEYIALLNSDDAWKENKLEMQVRFLDENLDIGAVFTDALFINEEGKELTKETFQWADVFNKDNRSSGQWFKQFFFHLNCFCHPSILIRKNVYDKTNLYNHCLRQLPDFAMWIDVLKFTSISVIKEKLVVFTIFTQTENTSTDTPTNKVRNMNEIYLIMKEFFYDMPLNVFIDGFNELLFNKHIETYEEMQCEQAFLYFKTDNDISHIFKLIGIEKMYSLLKIDKTRIILRDKYKFTDKEFFDLTGSLEINDYSNKNFSQIVIDQVRKKVYPSKKMFNFLRSIYKNIKK
ncbi:glycosyltransferase [Clostridium estertheticum]|uniref:glycosyltransferase family 2 protein n=1 Tax=Clostridium estertheticum TaxID=238834 RepID=UPI001C7D5B5B|nr:glycosyltransferase [Clostridium estertheticum]MBX4258430.1 glycosyltransferase [Clostridium estertheticum]WLC69615.1 glycosyltransferase [Clostridium estertheticum]